MCYIILTDINTLLSRLKIILSSSLNSLVQHFSLTSNEIYIKKKIKNIFLVVFKEILVFDLSKWGNVRYKLLIKEIN